MLDDTNPPPEKLLVVIRPHELTGGAPAQQLDPRLEVSLEDRAGALEISSGCSHDLVQALNDRCKAKSSDGLRDYQILKGQADQLRADSFRHNLVVSSYQQKLANFQAKLTAFQNELQNYQKATAGLT